MEGLIEVIPNRGAFALGFSEQDIRDIFDLRKLYEIQAVKWAIERITDDELEALGETYDFMEFYTKKNDIEKMININMNFHQLIYIASHNKTLQNILSSYQLYIKHAKRSHTFSNGYLPVILEEHREIYSAFVDKDILLGAKAIEKHMDNSIERIYFE
jgi:DNA-binding GntR family transcriptional regulator